MADFLRVTVRGRVGWIEYAVALSATADFREGLDAFLDRRPPVWSD
jgi:enoyl-CoA hydratase/carnithine racemase